MLYIYKITNNINGKIYVGKHISNSLTDSYYGSGIAIKKAIKKYGKENFTKEVLLICEDEDHQNKMEIFYIDKFNSLKKGYNMTKGGEGKLGHKMSEKSKKKSSNSIKIFYKNNPERRKKISDFAKTRVGDKNPFFGKTLSKKHIKKLTKARIKAITGSKNPSAVKIRCIELNKTFETCKEAAEYVNLKHSTTILKCAKGQRNKAGGFTWELIK